MAKKGKDDDLAFDPGDELFPLDPSAKNGRDSKPPKGVKGYLKNVVKSAFNLTVKVNKTLYPEVFSLAEESRFEDDSGNKFSIKKEVERYKNNAKNFITESKDVAKDIAKDAKEAIKTGYFVKTEDEEMDMGDMFGDLGGDDDFNFDFGGDDDFGNDSWDDTGNETSSKKKGRLSTSDAVIKSSAASARATLRASNKQIAATIGSTQSHIQHETALFAKQLQIDQERHIQKMKVLKNIAHNIATTVKQNNLSIKAQMEYSTKSLAFTQDLAAMIKEIRDAQWVLTKPEEKDNSTKKSKWKSIVGGGGMDLGAWLKHYKENVKGNAFGGIGNTIEMISETLNSFSDMGMKKSTLIKQMAGGAILDAIVKGSLQGSTLNKIDSFNVGVAGLPAILNAKLGKWGKGETGDLEQLFSNIANGKNVPGFLKKAANWAGKKVPGLARKFGENAYVEESIHYTSDRFKMGDPNKVHPFDNKAHKVLTEIIPAYLRKISAGVNHTEEEVFDYNANKFVKMRSIESKIDESQKSVLEYTRGIDDYRDSINNLIDINGDDILKKLSVRSGIGEDVSKIKENVKKHIDEMIKSWMEAGNNFDDDMLRSACCTRKGGDIEDGPNTEDLFKYYNCSPGSIERYYASMMFYQTFMAWKKAATKDEKVKETMRNFFIQAQAYRSRMTENNMSLEEEISMGHDSTIYSNKLANKNAESRLKDIDQQIANIDKAIGRAKDGQASLVDKGMLKKKIEQKEQLEREKNRLMRETHQNVGDINASNFKNMEDSFMKVSGSDFEKFRMSSLEDSSTHGLVQNIYNLLLSGIDVYIKKPSKERENMMKAMREKIGTNYGKKIEFEQKERKLEQFTKISKYDYDKLMETDANGKRKFTGSFYNARDLEHPYTPKLEDVENGEVYVKTTEKQAYFNKINREDKFSTGFGNSTGGIFASEFLKKIPGLNKLAPMFDKIQNTKASIGNALLAPLYGEDIGQDTKKELAALPGNIKKQVTEKINASKEELEKFKKNPKGYVKELSSEIKNKGKTAINKATANADAFIGNNKVIGDAVNKTLDVRLKRLKPDKSNTTEFKNLGQAIASITDPTFQNTVNHPTLNMNSKISYLLNKSSKPGYEALQPFVGSLTNFAKQTKKILDGKSKLGTVVKNSINETKEKAKTSVSEFVNKDLMNEVKKNLDNGLMKLKPEKGQEGEFKNLGEAIASITDPDFHAKLNKFEKPELKIRYLISKSHVYDSLKPFVPSLIKYEEKVKDYNAADGSLSSLVTNKVKKLGSKVLGKLKDKAANILKGFGNAKAMMGFFNSKATIDGVQYSFKEALVQYAMTNGSVINELTQKINEISKESKDSTTNTLKMIQEYEKLLNRDDEDAKKWLAPFKPELEKFREKVKNGSNLSGSNLKDTVINKAKDFGKSIYDKMKKKLFGDDSDPKKLLPPDLYEVTSIDGSTKLGDEILQIAKDNGFLPLLSHIPSGLAKAKYLQGLKVEGLEKYKTGLGEYISNYGTNLKNKAKNIGKTIKGFLGNSKVGAAIGGLFGKAKGAIDDAVIRSGSTTGLLGGSFLVPKDGESIVEKIRKKFKKNERDSLVKGDSAEEQKQAKEDAKKESREEKMEEHMKRTADALESMKKDGIGLDKETKKDMADSNEKAAFQSESKNGEGVLNTIQGFINKTGLKNTRAGQAIGRATGKVKDLLSSAGKLVPQGSGPLSKIGLVKNLANGLSKIPGVGGILGGVAGAAGGAGGLALSAAKLGGKVGLKVAKGGLGLFKKLFDKILNLGPIKKLLKDGVSGVLKKVVVGAVSKFAPNLGAKLATVSAPVIGWAIWGAQVVAGFMKGLIKCKDYFKLGNGAKPDIGMKLCSGFANCLDAALFGIPSIVCGLLKKPNVAVWLYEFVGSKAKKAALERYRQYNEKRGIIFGVESGDALAAFEARAANEGIGGAIKNGINKAARWIGNKLTGGMMMNNDEKDAKTLGFKYVEIFKYWKENKFKPLTELRQKMANELNLDLSDMDEMVKFDAEGEDVKDEDGDGKVDDEESEAAEAQRKIEIQQDFRVKYLEAARAWVLDNKLAWLSCRCSPEMFKKKTGKSAGKAVSTKGALGRLGDNIKKNKGNIIAAGVGFALGGPIGAALAVGAKVLGPKIAQAGRTALKAIGSGLKNAGNAIGDWAKNRWNDTKQFFKNVGDGISKAGQAIKSGVKSVVNKGKELLNKGKELYKKGIDVLKKIIDKLTDIGAIKKMLGRNIQQLKSELLGSIQKFSSVLATKLAFVSVPVAGWAIWGAGILKGFVKGLVKAKEYFKIESGVPINIGMRLCSGLANCLDAALFGIPSIICAKLGKPNIAVWLYEKIGNKAAQDAINKYREYNLERAKVYGVSDPDALINFENRAAGDTFGEKAKAKIFRFGRWLGNKLTFGAMESNDDHDSRILGFKYVGIFKYWKENKFKPLYDLRTKIAESMNVKLKDMEEMILFDPTDPDDGDEENEEKKEAEIKSSEESEEAEGMKEETAYELQQRFRAQYLVAAKKWVVENKLAWLTNKTTPEEFSKYTGKSAGKELSDKSALQRGKEGFMSTLNTAKNTFNKGIGAVKSGFSSAYSAVSSFGSAAVGKLQTLTSAGSSFIKSGSVKAKEWMSKIFAKYSINDNNNARSAMEEAQAAIQAVNLHGDPNYYSETTVETGHGMPSDVAASMNLHTSGNGGAEAHKSNSGKFYVRKDGKKVPINTVENGGADDTNTESSTGLKNEQFNNTSKNKSTTKNKKSIVESFTGDYGKAIVDRLNILEEMHKENLRYHGVAEEFFKAALQMMSAIASSSGRSGLSDRLSSMINEISY